MRFCQDHWDKLRKALDDRGLTRFIAKDSEAAMKLTGDQLKGIQTGKGCPLLNAHWAIINNALKIGGLDLMEQNEDGTDRCPICFLKTCPCGNPQCPAEFEKWIEHAADAQDEYFKEDKVQA